GKVRIEAPNGAPQPVTARDRPGLARQPLEAAAMPTFPPSTSALTALGFTEHDGVLVAPRGSVVTFTPIGNFLQLRIAHDGSAVTAVLAKAAIKICREAQ